jgi:hypothetical protein
MMIVMSIVPSLPPAIDGVGDYALHLARQLRQDFGIETHFIVGDTAWNGSATIEGFAVEKLTVHTTDAFLSLLVGNSQKLTTVLLHFSGYGYAKWGCPFWLIDGLEKWQIRTPHARLVTMFHEIFNSLGPPWRHNFWVSAIQKQLAIRLTRLSDRCLTNRQQSAQTLYAFSQGKHTQIPSLPIYSNVGEPKQVLPLARREKRLVIFGQRGTRLSAYQQSLQTIEQLCRALQIQEVVDIGSTTDLNLSAIGEIPVIELGQRSASEISEILKHSIAGFLHYNTEVLAKSGVFAAYCAHGLLPITPKWGTSTVDGIQAGKQYWAISSRSIHPSSEELQTIADTAYVWYQNHRLCRQALTFAYYLFEDAIAKGHEHELSSGCHNGTAL